MIKPYIFNYMNIRSSSNHETSLILEGLGEVCKALSIISQQLEAQPEDSADRTLPKYCACGRPYNHDGACRSGER